MNKYVRILRQLYQPVAYYKKRYPKAAKKRRIIKKWENRFGKDFLVTDLIYKENPLLKLLEKQDLFQGSYIPVPFVYGEEE